MNRKRVARIMRERDIQGVTRRNQRSLTRPDKTARPAPDLIGRLPRRSTGNQTGRGHHRPAYRRKRLCLACWLDLATREVVGYSMADHHRATLVVDALKMAAGRDRLRPGRIGVLARVPADVLASGFHESCRPLSKEDFSGEAYGPASACPRPGRRP
ncbi:hypothetical protein [Streptomyces sp. NPDC058964]|uniref:hypothetical protein n=1 Tax=Streptomyces sp. NPDC058964 TaxID=3346681 RepID=UPI0036941601